jgi:Ner family transcriptional regulator
MTQTKKHKDWHHAIIVARLHMRGTTLRQLSKENGLNPTALSVTKERPWLKAEAIIAKAIGVKPSEIWPSRYAHREQKRLNVEQNKRRRIPLNKQSATGDSIKECSHDCNIYDAKGDRHGI